MSGYSFERGALAVEHRAEAEALYAAGVPAKAVGERFGVSRCVILGIAHRQGWISGALPRYRPAPRRTLHDRLDALHARMDALLAECAKVKSHLPEPADV